MMSDRVKTCWKVIGAWGDKSCPELRQHVHCRNCPVFSTEGRALLDREPPPGYMDEWASLIAQKRDDGDHLKDAITVFRINLITARRPAP